MRGLSLCMLLFSYSLKAQVCLSGLLGPSGPGCGCQSGCNLAPIGGPMCIPPVTGNCSSGAQTLTYSLPLPADCEVKVVARMKPWPTMGCPSSGADAADRIKVEGAFAKPWLSGASNSAIADSLTQLGGNITVWAQSNRADEVTVWEVIYVSGNCPFCSAFLPVQLRQFSAFVQEDEVVLRWITASEVNNDFFSISQSLDGLSFTHLLSVDAAGNAQTDSHYEVRLPLVTHHSTWYQLTQQDINGTQTTLGTLHVEQSDPLPQVRPTADGALEIQFPSGTKTSYQVRLSDAQGRQLFNQTMVGPGVSRIPAAEGFCILVICGASQEVLFTGKYIFP